MSRKSLRRSKRVGVPRQDYAESRTNSKKHRAARGQYGSRAGQPTLPRGANGHHRKSSIHLDHIRLDITLSEQGDGRPLRKPWLLAAIDTHSRTLLGLAITEEEPDYKAVVERIFSSLILPPGCVTTPDG